MTILGHALGTAVERCQAGGHGHWSGDGKYNADSPKKVSKKVQL